MKDLHAYIAVASNTSGSTPKDLYEDVAEELDKQVSMLISLYGWLWTFSTNFMGKIYDFSF